jgi:hypothetical protein
MLVLALMALALPPRLCAQCPLSMTTSYAPVERLSVAEIDFQHFESRTLLFTLNITNTQLVDVYASLSIILHIKLASGTPVPDPSLTFITKPFVIPPGGRVLTNLDIGRGAQDIRDSLFEFPQEVKEKVQDVALGTGKFPAGIYTFNLELHALGCAPVTTTPIVFNLLNPSRVELRSPRDGETTTQFPLFEFYMEGQRGTLTVAEKSADQSREDAIARRPAMLEAQLNGENAYLYSGGRPLEDGKSYVWTVTTSALDVGGLSSGNSSPIGLFTVARDASLTQDDLILTILEQMLGQRYGALFEQIRSGGLKLSGRYDLNGSALTQTELLELVNELRAIANDIDLQLE